MKLLDRLRELRGDPGVSSFKTISYQKIHEHTGNHYSCDCESQLSVLFPCIHSVCVTQSC